jgi:two-component system, chemotaxis family, CheB/CheR fusion protein
VRVLVADDNADAVWTLSTVLEDEGHKVRSVYSGSDVLPAVRDFKPDVVVLDIKMPGLSGYEVARTIQSRYGSSRPLLIGVSGHYKLGSDQVLARIVGFDHFFAKPYDPQAVLAALPKI